MRLKEMRIQKGLSQREVADVLFCSTTVYSRYETGERQPSIETLIKLSDFYGVSVDCLIGHPEMPVPVLSQFETELITASREADERSREDAILLLKSHRKI